jgi:TRAP-type C4-dicarboxylate transport system permease small subunit
VINLLKTWIASALSLFVGIVSAVGVLYFIMWSSDWLRDNIHFWVGALALVFELCLLISGAVLFLFYFLNKAEEEKSNKEL